MNEEIEILEVTSAGKHDPEFVAEAMRWRVVREQCEIYGPRGVISSDQEFDETFADEMRAALQAHLEGGKR